MTDRGHPEWAKCAWEFDNGEFHLYLKVDEDSTPAELEAEAEYWMEQVSLHELDGLHRKEIYAAVKWMMEAAESNGS